MPWSTTALCTPPDVEAEVGSLASVLGVAPGSGLPETLVTQCIAAAKAEIEERLLGWLPSILVANYTPPTGTTYAFGGRTWDALDGVLDEISNPTVLKRAAVAATIAKMYEHGVRNTHMAYSREDPDGLRLVVLWEKRFESRLEVALRLLKIDLDQNGDITDSERVRNNIGTLWRS